jgi:RNA polymerase sigma factor for flagellar operon FliA
MIDGMRRMGPWTRRGYERARIAKALDSAVESAADGQPDPSALSPDEAAEKLRQHMASMVTAMTIGVFAEQAFEGEEIISKDPNESAEEMLSERQLRSSLMGALDALPEPDGSIVKRHYLGGERLDLIAAEMGFSKSWASRIHSRALKKLGARLRAFGRGD